MPSGALGMGQANDTLLTVFGCSRVGTQVTCDTDINNQSQSVTQYKSSDSWKDAYLLDDKGDKHSRNIAFFLNDAGAQRFESDIPYGETTRFIFVFNNVPASVKKVSLKSSSGLDVEDITITTPSGAGGGDAGTAAARP